MVTGSPTSSFPQDTDAEELTETDRPQTRNLSSRMHQRRLGNQQRLSDSEGGCQTSAGGRRTVTKTCLSPCYMKPARTSAAEDDDLKIPRKKALLRHRFSEQDPLKTSSPQKESFIYCKTGEMPSKYELRTPTLWNVEPPRCSRNLSERLRHNERDESCKTFCYCYKTVREVNAQLQKRDSQDSADMLAATTSSKTRQTLHPS